MITAVQFATSQGTGTSISCALNSVQVGNTLIALVWGLNTAAPTGPPEFNVPDLSDTLNNTWQGVANLGGSITIFRTHTVTGNVTVTTAPVPGFPGGQPLFMWLIEITGISRFGLLGAIGSSLQTGGSVTTFGIGPFVTGIPCIYFSAGGNFSSTQVPTLSSFVAPIVATRLAAASGVVFAKSPTTVTSLGVKTNTFSGAGLTDTLQGTIFGGVNDPIPLSLSCNNPPPAMAGIAYSHPLRAAGGTLPYTFFLQSGTLPPGLTLGPANGVISGTPTTGGIFNFLIRVQDSVGGIRITACTITVTASASDWHGTFVGFLKAGFFGGGTS